MSGYQEKLLIGRKTDRDRHRQINRQTDNGDFTGFFVYGGPKKNVLNFSLPSGFFHFLFSEPRQKQKIYARTFSSVTVLAQNTKCSNHWLMFKSSRKLLSD